jgi:signal transduction histidine kinase
MEKWGVLLRSAIAAATAEIAAAEPGGAPEHARALALDGLEQARRLIDVPKGAPAPDSAETLTAMVVHDLRNVAAGLQLRLDVIARDPARTQDIEAARRGARQLARLVEDLVDIQQMVAGALSLRIEPSEVVPLIGEAIALVEPLADGRRIEILGEIPHGTVVACDRVRVLQVVSNLLGNAVRVTPEGGAVEVLVEPHRGAVRVAVRDTGPGIPADELVHVTEPWFQGRAGGGVGLGLHIARGIIEAHGGQLTIASRVGTGTTVAFTLPPSAPVV